MQLPACHPYKSQYDMPYSLGVICLITFIAATLTFTALCIHGGLFSDEHFHAPQIWQFFAGTGVTDHKITVPLTYHYIIGFLVQKIGLYDDNILRIISLLISLITIPLFYRLFEIHSAQSADVKTLQLFFLPTGFIYYFLLYTDIWALLSIAFCLYFALRNRYILAALAGVIALCIRQDAILWVGLAFLLICSENLSTINRDSIKTFIVRGFTRAALFLPIFIGFIAFVIINGGVALGDKDMHNAGIINTTNLYIFLLLAWFVFLPLNIAMLGRIGMLFKRFPTIMLAIVVAAFVFYLWDVKNTHPYNQTLLNYFLHNKLAHTLSDNLLLKSLSFIPVFWMALTLLVMPLQQTRFKWMLVIFPLALILHPLIDPRYYLPAFLAIQLIRPSASRAAELSIVYASILATAYIVFGTLNNNFFL